MAPGIFACFGVAFGTALDNLAVGARYGLQGRQVQTAANMFIACSNSGTTAITMIAGEALSKFLSVHAASLLGASIFLVLGALDMLTAWGQWHDQDWTCEKNSIRREKHAVGIVEIVPVALGLCATNIAGGIVIYSQRTYSTPQAAAGAAGFSVHMSVFLSLACSFVLFSAGFHAAEQMSSLLHPRKMSLLSGTVLILLGVSQLPS